METAGGTSWFGRNWGWFVPLGCLGALVLVAAFALGIAAIVMASIKSSDSFTQGVEMARSNDEVRAALGEPIEPGWFVMGSLNVSGPSGEAKLSIPLSGPNGDGTLYVEAEKHAGQWSFDLAEVEVDGTPERIHLLQAGEE